MTTNLNYPKPVKPDDGCNWLPVILWRMNAGARARSRSVFVAAPRPAPVPGITPQKPIKREIIAPTVSGRRRKTHIGTVIYSRGEKNVRLSEGATVWSAGSNEHFDKKTGLRVGSIGRHRLVLESIRPLQASDAQQDSGSVTAHQLVSVMKGKTLSYQGIGTPHTHDSLYDEVESMGADCLTIKLFGKEFRIEEKQSTASRYSLPFRPEYVFVGIHIGARLLVEGVDYRLNDDGIEFAEAPGTTVDCYADCEWPERFTPEEMTKRRRETRTINEWDSQYQLHSKPVGEVRLDPDRIREYNVQPEIRYANRSCSMWLGQTQIVGAVAWWDVATGKVKADASAFSLIFTDARGHLYWHVCQGLTGELAEFDDNDKITGGQVMQIKELVLKYQIPLVCVEVNGPGSFAGKLLIQALKGTGCGVREEFSVTNKQKRILDAFEAPLSSRFLWAHTDVLDGPMYDQMRDFNPALTNQPDDFIDSGSGAISSTPVRIGKLVGIPTAQAREHWQPNDGDHMVAVDY